MYKDELHQLIKALDKGEKRRFKLFASMLAGSNRKLMINLFDTLAAMPNFDPDALRAGDPSLPADYASARTRLVKLILKSFRAHDQHASVDAELYNHLLDIEILHSKKIFKTCRMRINKATKLALKFEKYDLLLRILQCEHRLLISDPKPDKSDWFQRIHKLQSLCTERMTEINRLHLLHEECRAFARELPRSSDGSIPLPFQKILNHPELQIRPISENLLARTYYHNIRGMIEMATGNSARAYQEYLPLIEDWSQQQHRIEDMADLYLGVYNNYLACCLFRDRHYADFQPAIQRLMDLSFRDSAILTKFRRVAYFNDFIFRWNHEPFATVVPLVQEIKEWMEKVQEQLPLYQKLVFYYNFANFYFLNDDYSEANYWNLQIRNAEGSDERIDIRDFARMFQLILQFEMGDFDLREYTLRSVKRFLSRSQNLQDLESALLKYFQAVNVNPADQLKAASELEISLENIRRAPGDRTPLGLRELTLWARGKVNGKGTTATFQDMVQENRKYLDK